MAESATERLTAWWAKENRRWFLIERDDEGYGSSSWTVKLSAGRGPGCTIVTMAGVWESVMCEENRRPVFREYSYVPGEDTGVEPTLDETIHAAIDAAERQEKNGADSS